MSINLDRMKMGYFCLWKNQGGFIGDQIEKYQLSQGYNPEDAKYVHIDVLGGGPYAIRVNPPQSKCVDLVKLYKGREFKVVKFKDDLYTIKRYKVAFWAATHCNIKYDWLGVLKFKLKGFIWHKKNQYFCSENAAWALFKEYPDALYGIKPHLVLPADFLNPKWFEVTYEGIIE